MKTREELLKEFEEEPTAKKFSKSDKVIHFTPEELKQILSAPTKAQMKCPYCHEPTKAIEIDNGNTLAFDLTGNQNKFIFGTDSGFSYTKKFKYCPICGCKVGE